MFENVSKNTLWQIAGKALTGIISIITTGILTRLLQDTGYGQYTLITALVLLFGNVSDWGTNTIAVREAAKNSNKQQTIYANSLVLRVALSLISLVLFNLFISFNSDWKAILLPLSIGSLVLIPLSLKTSFNIIFQTRLKYGYIVCSEIASSTALFIGVYFVTRQHGGLQEIIWIWFIAVLIAASVGFIFARRETKFNWQFDPKTIKALIKESLPAGALFILFSVYNRIDILILGHFHSSSDVGIYGLAYKIYEQLILVAAFFMNAVFPYLAREFASNKKDSLKKYYQKSFDILFIGSIVVCFVSFIFAPIIVQVLAPSNFLPSVTPLRILSLAFLVSYLNHLTGYSLIAFGKQRTSLLIALVALLFNVFANWLLIPNFSYMGAAWLTVATEGLVLLLSMLAVYKTVKYLPSLTSWVFSFQELVVKRKIDF